MKKALTYFFTLLAFISHGQIDHWETVVFEYDNWDYIVPNTSLPSDWNQPTFSASGWQNGPGGFGYGDGDDNTVLPNGTISCYQRILFSIVDTADIEAAALTIDYDDGFVAYLNGVEIQRDLVAQGADYNDPATGLHEAQIYQGNYPAQYTISKQFLSDNLVNGTNVLAIESHNESVTSSDLTSRAYFHLGITSTSNNYSPTPGWFIEPLVFTASNLPIVVINTDNNVSIPDEPKVDAEMGIIYNGEGNMNYLTDPFNEFFGDIGIELRGSSSQSFPKKPYGLETRGPDSSNYNASIFGWPADNDWALIAPYSDKSLIRNVLTYEIGQQLGWYAPRTKLVEVMLNGEYIGVYVFTERIKQNPGRVNVDKLEYADTSASTIDGGYIVKIDKTTGGGIIAWTSPFAQAAPATGPIHYQLHDPTIDTIHPNQLQYIQDYITDFETALDGANFDDPVLGYQPYINMASFVDFMIVNEISKNVDGYRISTFYHKQSASQGGKLVAGPLWDFNLAWGNANYCAGGNTDGWEIYFNDVCGGGGSLNNPFHWNRLVQDSKFTHALNCRWQDLRQNKLHTDTLHARIDELATYLADAADRNFSKWPVLGNYVWPNNYVGNTYQEEIDYLKNWTSARMLWLDANMFGSCPDLNIGENELKVQCYPNPAIDQLNITVSELQEKLTLKLFDLSGKCILSDLIINENTSLDISFVAKGSYILELADGTNKIYHEKIIIQ